MKEAALFRIVTKTRRSSDFRTGDVKLYCRLQILAETKSTGDQLAAIFNFAKKTSNKVKYVEVTVA